MKPYQQETLEYGDEVPKVMRESLVVLREAEPDEAGEVKQTVLFSGKDFCPKCQKVIERAIQTLKMEPQTSKPKSGVRTTVKKEDKKEDKKGKGKNGKSAKPTPEKDPPKPEPEPEPEPEPPPSEEGEGDEDEHLF
jgi:hypothetical protein